MWFTPLLHTLKCGSKHRRAGYAARSSRNHQSHRERLQVEMLETRFLPSGFGSVGYVTTSLSPNSDAAYAVTLQPDGKILAAGVANFAASNAQFATVRYNSDGNLDTSFNGTGEVLTSLSSVGISVGHALALQTDGKIVVGGDVRVKVRPSTDYNVGLVRYNSNGTLDTTFGGGKKPTGIVLTDFGSATDYLRGLAIQSDGKIVAAGIVSNGSANLIEVARYNSNGTLDTTFGTGGLVASPTNGVVGEATGVALQADGKIVVSAGVNNQFEIVRFNTNGALDTSFAGSGIVTTAIGDATKANGLAIYPNLGTANDGKIVAVGPLIIGTNHGYAVARYNLDGSLDSTFGTGGIVQTILTPGNFAGANSVVIQPDGKIDVVGQDNVSSPGQYAVVRYNADGSLDAAFGSGGIVVTEINNSQSIARAVALQTNGQIVVAGDAGGDFFVARYNTDGTLDPVPEAPAKAVSAGHSSQGQSGRENVGVLSHLTAGNFAPDILHALAAETASFSHHRRDTSHPFWSDVDFTGLVFSIADELARIG